MGTGAAWPPGSGRRVVVEIYGEQYPLKGNADEATMRALAERLDQRMREVARRRPRLSATQVAVLTALNLLSELADLEERVAELARQLEAARAGLGRSGGANGHVGREAVERPAPDGLPSG
jgi:cell division protein ZapA